MNSKVFLQFKVAAHLYLSPASNLSTPLKMRTDSRCLARITGMLSAAAGKQALRALDIGISCL